MKNPLAERNIELMKERDLLRDQLNALSFKKDQEYKKLWQENEKLRRKIEMINEFTNIQADLF